MTCNNGSPTLQWRIPGLIYCPLELPTGVDPPPKPRRSRELSIDPLPKPWEDPRPKLPCTPVCHQCRPGPLPTAPMRAGLKLRQLDDAYNCRVSDACLNYRKQFYNRWQHYMDTKVPRLPNYDYTQYCCDNYHDMSENNDFLNYDHYLVSKKGPREEALRTFLFTKNLAEAHRERYDIMNECPTLERWIKYEGRNQAEEKSLGWEMEDKHRLYHEDALTYWQDRVDKRSCPETYVESTTPMKNWNTPFRKDASFSCPVGGRDFCGGNEEPMKAIRNLKRI